MKQTEFTKQQRAQLSTGRILNYLALLDRRAAGTPDKQLQRDYRVTKSRIEFLLQDWVRPALEELLWQRPLNETGLIRSTDEPPTITTILTDSNLDRYFQ
ncbi:hypothetical protein CLV58_109146 [Spirosoma oryzae]|uniref:Uncharacterized protein n=1 Tax=Spirosoma oryzae TaxID=1469603 RepID=A0A2T0SYF5_9BACT|nr:hypothetical protein [Spirosoma oryzae]PRY38419.1 hypothetical protein CLV58_109146 [Spirosoma oryzae]